MSVRDYHLLAARRGDISGVVLIKTDVRSGFIQHLGVEIHGEYGGCRKAACVGGEVRKISLQRAFCGAICEQEGVSTNNFYYWAKRQRTARASSWASRTVLPRRASATAAADGNAGGPRSVSAGVAAWKCGCRRVPGGDPLPGRVPGGGGRQRRGEAFQEVVVKDISGESPPCSPPRCCLPWGRRDLPLRQAGDMRRSFDGLHAIVQSEFRRDIRAGDVFVFLNRRRIGSS